MDDKEKKIIDVLMKDYEILKTYSTITSPTIRYNVISFVLATIGIIISGILFALPSKNLSIIILQTIFIFTSYFIPAFCITIIAIWLSEEERMIRIGKYLLKMEKNINKKLNENILNWDDMPPYLEHL